MSAALTTATDSEAGGEVRAGVADSFTCYVDSRDAQVLLSAVLPYAYQLEVGPVFKARTVLRSCTRAAQLTQLGGQAELDSLVARMKATEVRLAQLEDRRKCVCRLLQCGSDVPLTRMPRSRFDPLAAVVSDGKQQELQMLTTKVQTMRAEAAVKAWARVAAIMSLASQSASKEYAAARRLLDEAKAAAAPPPPKPRGRR